MWLSNSSVGRKVVMSVTGIALVPVSYTHLDVYKRQTWNMCAHAPVCISVGWATVHMPKTESMSS